MRIWIKTIMAIVNIKIIFWISGSEEYHRKYSCYHDPSLNPISWEGRSSHFHCQEHIPLTFFFYIFFRKYIFMWFVNIRRNEWTDSKVKISLSWRWWNVGDERRTKSFGYLIINVCKNTLYTLTLIRNKPVLYV